MGAQPARVGGDSEIVGGIEVVRYLENRGVRTMTQASDLRDLAKQASIYEIIGQSGKTYVFFFFPDSVCAARRVATANQACARLDFARVDVKQALVDCGATDACGTHTYQRVRDLVNRLEGRN